MQTTNIINLSTVDEGRGVSLVFVHGFPLSRGVWQKQIDAFRSSHRVIAPDLPGLAEDRGARADRLSPPAAVIRRAATLTVRRPAHQRLPPQLLPNEPHVHVRTLRAAAHDGRLAAIFSPRPQAVARTALLYATGTSSNAAISILTLRRAARLFPPRARRRQRPSCRSCSRSPCGS